MHVTPKKLLSSAQLATIASQITARVMADKRIRAALTAPVGKSAPRPVLRARPVTKAAGTASSAASIDRLKSRLDALVATQRAGRAAFSAKVDAAVGGLAGIQKDLAGVREQFDAVRGIRKDLGKVVERMTAAAARRPR